jgi:lysophospholipase L1-like esterase
MCSRPGGPGRSGGPGGERLLVGRVLWTRREAGLKSKTRPTVAIAAFCVLAIVAMTIACDSGPTTPTPDGPKIVCPAALTVPSATGGSVVVDYPKPSATGGAGPVTITCRPAAGTSFPPGTTSVTCSAVDSNQKAASCSFNVTVAKTPQIALTKFLAFGDSITEGKSGDSCGANIPGATNCSLVTTMNPLERLRALKEIFAELEESPAAYPHVLLDMLTRRYTGQTITMPNEGFGGELVSNGRTRLHDLFTSNSAAMAAQVLLLQEGANDMNVETPIAQYVDNLRAMVQEGRRRGMRVFVGTLLPQREHGCRAYDYCDGKYDTITANIAIRSMAAVEGATLVDLYPVFDGQTNTLLGLDGLHPTVAGYLKIAETFFAAVRQQLDVP